MREYRLLVLLTICLVVTGTVNAGYWFQTGARAASSSGYNNGGSISIETMQQHPVSGSFGAWIGETLGDGSFIQIGYLVENESGSFPSLCTASGCNDYENITAGDAEWFYEYFPSNATDLFLGRIGNDGSAGVNGSFNTYKFSYNQSVWQFFVDGKVVGSVDLSAGSSGSQSPIAFIELANTSDANAKLNPVIFTNFSVYKNGLFSPVPSAYTYIGYGQGSQTALRNPYGVAELSNKIDYFDAGSGIPHVSDGTSLWSFGYDLRIISPYGNTNNTAEYYAFSIVNISEPKVVYVNNYTRYLFTGWTGTGNGANSGSIPNTSVEMFGNVTEKANWQLQYLVNATSNYSSVTGGGWYNAGATVNYAVPSNVVYRTPVSRAVFDRWNNGNQNISGSFVINTPISLTPVWTQQFFANATSPYGNTTGSGWYNNGTSATFTVSQQSVDQNSTQRLAFYSWSNGNKTKTIKLRITAPLQLQAKYLVQYLTSFSAKDRYGTYVKPPVFYINQANVGNSTFLFAKVPYVITGVNYTGTRIPLNVSFEVSGPSKEVVVLPLYNVKVVTDDVFGIPVNATDDLSFANGTKVMQSTGPEGQVMFDDVPYGILNGNATYLGISERINVRNGEDADVIFISKDALIVLVIAVFASAGIYVVLARRHDKLNKNAKSLRRSSQ